MTAASIGSVTDTGIELYPDPSRVVTRFFVPGREDVGPGDSRAAPVIVRLLGLAEPEVAAALADVEARFTDRHRDFRGTLRDHAQRVMSRIDAAAELSDARTLLLGASFTHEYAIEGAALCNPSIVVHPDQPSDGTTRFVLSVRGIGEGHRSSIGFRTGTVDSAGSVTLAPADPYPATAVGTPGLHHRAAFTAHFADRDADRENTAFVLDALPDEFDDAQLDSRISALTTESSTRRHTGTTARLLRDLARSTYRTEFAEETSLSERVLWPHSPAEAHGMEDARFVRFTDPAGASTYYATYTAFDGTNVAQHLLQTYDFRTFTSSALAGAAATGKGLAIFPRMIDGRFAALSRFDRETNSIAFSDDIRCWSTSETIQAPDQTWEILQLGNCGSPIETEHGWLVLTHGVGPMRTYALGALLLDLDEPAKVLASTTAPILTPVPGRRDGYVPNVVYTCGALAVGDLLVLPYGVGDQSIAIGTLSIEKLIASMTRR